MGQSSRLATSEMCLKSELEELECACITLCRLSNRVLMTMVCLVYIVCVNSESCGVFSVAARELISRLLQIKMRKRFTADKSLAHDWLQVVLLVFGRSWLSLLCCHDIITHSLQVLKSLDACWTRGCL